MRIRESSCAQAAQLCTHPFLELKLLVFIIPLIPEIFTRGDMVVRVMGLSLGYNSLEELQVNVRVVEQSALDVERSLWLKVKKVAWLACAPHTK